MIISSPCPSQLLQPPAAVQRLRAPGLLSARFHHPACPPLTCILLLQEPISVILAISSSSHIQSLQPINNPALLFPVRLMSWPDPPSIYKLHTPESSYPPPSAPAIPTDITPQNVGSFLPEHFARVYAIPDSWKEANGSLIIEAINRVQALTCDMFEKLASIQDDT
jgi:hypothetical protein